MKEILIISNYYPPEKGAAANRIEQLALKLHQNNYKVSVICPLGNYPKGELFPEYKGKFSVTENRDNITVKRLWIYPSVSKNLVVRIISVLSFSLSLFFYLLFKKTPEKVVVQSPPLLLSFISVFVLSLKNKKIILNISDLWPMAAIELKALKKNSLSHKFSLFLERFNYKNATLIIGQSNEIISHVKSFFPEKKCFLYRNFPDHKVENFDLIFEENQPIKIFYAGLLGIAQGVLELCEKITLDNLNIELHLFGDGAEKNQIETLFSSEKGKNIFFHGMMERNDLHEKLKTFDIAIVPLKVRIYGSVPSKIFEYGSLGFPILYFGGGEGETIVLENYLGWVASVESYSDLNFQLQLISKLSKSDLFEMKKRIFDESKNRFSLDNQIQYLMKKDVF
ncbi:glycosyltransferase family 4 protein [Flavobacterium aquatile]|uniref:Glycosyl transferase family 1 n=1 Tax=Flavobacterium aquatile LMG 4008 = ATCC 11947 TaxID=1453498 RepID=A0A095SW08_9FLAO|nr:glycosyltransferase family 4 protein [Flavobacterium aquatile]KGD68787.1 glycosyl transferase family 1 [Flavobacterium aquatile LMG 4008 = ATCC 11947]OXA69207.1 glycosyltransferase WbuB [Flavobacterium aquatile LMG 4008 = ATCC 11947]GEC79042.1 glycosyltransferase WbuB [Flavobacterium aquatile]